MNFGLSFDRTKRKLNRSPTQWTQSFLHPRKERTQPFCTQCTQSSRIIFAVQAGPGEQTQTRKADFAVGKTNAVVLENSIFEIRKQLLHMFDVNGSLLFCSMTFDVSVYFITVISIL
jgi:hypothetical protein